MPNVLTREDFVDAIRAFEQAHGVAPNVLRVRQPARNEIARWVTGNDATAWDDLEHGTTVTLWGCRVVCEYAGPDGVAGDFTYDFATEEELERRSRAFGGLPGPQGPTGSDDVRQVPAAVLSGSELIGKMLETLSWLSPDEQSNMRDRVITALINPPEMPPPPDEPRPRERIVEL